MQSAALTGVFYLRPVFYVAVAFVIFFIIFGRTLAKLIAGMLDARIAAVKAELEEATRLRQEAETMLAEAHSQRREAITQAQALLASAHDEASRLAESMATEADVAAKRRERMAIDRIAAAEHAVIAELRIAAIEIAAGATQQVLAAGLSPEDDDVLIDRAIAALPNNLRAA